MKSGTELIEYLEEIALGVLHLSIKDFGDHTVDEVYALYDGYLRRRCDIEDLFLIGAMATYKTQWGKKAPSYKKLTAYRTELFEKRSGIEDPRAWRERLEYYKKLEVRIDDSKNPV